MTHSQNNRGLSSFGDGENVLWAANVSSPKRKGLWKIIFWVSIFMNALLSIQNIRNGSLSLEAFLDIRAHMSVWVFFGACAMIVLLIWGIRKRIFSNNWMGKEITAYYVILITNQRLVLSNADGLENVELFTGQVKSVRPDYSNGSQALYLGLLNGAPLRSVTITTEGNIAALKRMIENGFMARDSAQGAGRVSP